jgi:hypothetical protein
MPIKLQKILTVAFFGIVIIAAFSLVMPTLNYIEFFRAIEKLTFSIKRFEAQIKGEDVLINATFILSNKGNYAFEVIRVSCSISLKKDSGPFREVAYPIFWFSGPPYPLLQPYSNTTIGPSQIRIKQAEVSAGQTVTWMISSEVLIDTFLGTIFPSLPSITTTATIS